jgi:hypothetical protein
MSTLHHNITTLDGFYTILWYIILLYHGRLVWGSKKYRVWDPNDERL